MEAESQGTSSRAGGGSARGPLRSPAKGKSRSQGTGLPRRRQDKEREVGTQVPRPYPQGPVFLGLGHHAPSPLATLTAPHSPGRGTSPLHFLPFPGPEMLCPVLFKRHVTAPPRPSYQKYLPSPFLTQEHLQLPPVPSSLLSSVSRDHVP